MRMLYDLLSQVGPSAASVLIVGESGTGKEMVARTLHELSPRREAEFVAVNCAAIPETLLESEIFGHERGAFTGAEGRRQGLFEFADGGTLFLDEVAEMAPATQAKLLRVLEERAFRRVGGAEEIRIDVRVLAATNVDPDEALREGKLRDDLFYRLNVFTLDLPPLESYRWPGNVRELRNVIERAVIMARGETIRGQDLPASLLEPAVKPRSSEGLDLRVGTTVEEAERNLILKTLEATGQNKTRAAEILGISLKTLHNKLKKYRQAT